MKLPPLPEQRRIAAILDKADAVRRKRRQTLDLADQFLRSAFLDMFGDPVTNPKGWPVKKLGELGAFVSGGTPDKSNDVFWDGFFPWVSPKDMKRLYLADAQDHVAELAFTETPLRRIPSGSILVVVRGMILAHTVPMGLTRVPVAINQDIKGLVPNLDIDPTFLLFSLLTQHGHILSKVGTAAHGTRRLEMRDVEALPIPLPPADRQSSFDSLATIANRVRETLLSRAGAADKLFGALVQRAFQGEL